MSEKSISFSCEGRKLTVKATLDDEIWNVGVFEDEQPLPYAKYSVSWEIQKDALTQYHDLVEGLMQHVRKEIEENSILLNIKI